MKLFIRVDTLEDCLRLQYDIAAFISWSKTLGLDLSIKKGQYMTFTCCNHIYYYIYTLYFIYTIDSNIIQPVNDSARDVRFYFCNSLSPHVQIEKICNKALIMLGFTKKNAIEFKLKNSLKSLYYSLVRPILEYVDCDSNTAIDFVS